jgi:hypothetical protein
MGLLRAARGAVIEDFAVEWGTGANEMELDGGFELVSNPDVPQLPIQQTPLNLFENRSRSDAPEIGPIQTVVNLPPPPAIQQAPKSEKLPVPLYPGFRCSIFAIVRQGAKPGPHSPYISITGNVLGRDVTLQVPVNPVSIKRAIREDLGVNKLLHTLGAKALIQVFEDVPSTPETRAQIERLGKRYSLTSSMTSFLAIDEENRTETEITTRNEAMQGPNFPRAGPSRSNTASSQTGNRGSSSPLRGVDPLGPQTGPTRRIVSLSDQASSPFTPSTPTTRQIRQQSPSISPVRSVPPTLETSVEELAPRRRGSLLGGLESAILKMGPLRGRSSRKGSLDEGRQSPVRGLWSLVALFDTRDRQIPMDSPDPPSTSAPVDTKITGLLPPSVEALARAQKFDGSFPSNPEHMRMVTSGGNPPLPGSLSSMRNRKELHAVIWVTLLTVACMEKHLADEREVWEFLAEKARDYVSATLQNICKDSNLANALMKELVGAATAAV